MTAATPTPIPPDLIVRDDVDDDTHPTRSDQRIVRALATEWGQMVSDRRQSLGFSQAELARRCVIRQQTVSRIECGLSIPSDRLKVQLAAALRTSPRTLFRWPPIRELLTA